MPETPVEIQPTNNQTIDDIIGNPPGWLLRSGISMVGLVFLVVILLSAIIKYPDKITTPGVLTTQNPPIAHFTKVQGVIDSLFVEDASVVKVGDPLLYIQNTLEQKDLDTVMILLERVKQALNDKTYQAIPFPENLSLGELSQAYGRLRFLMEEFQMTLQQYGVFQQIRTLEKEIRELQRLKGVSENEKKFAEGELKLMEKNFKRNEDLHKQKIISDYDKELLEVEMLRAQKQLSNLERGRIQNQIREEQLRLEVQRLYEERSSRVMSHVSGIREQIILLEQGMRAWDERFYLRAKTDGKVILKAGLKPNQQISPQTPLVTIVSEQIDEGTESEIYARLIATATGLGRIEVGDRVLLKLTAYPYKEFGLLTAKLRKISLLPEQDINGSPIYELEASLENNMTTTYGQTLDFSHEAGLLAEIITEDKTLLARIMNQFLSLLKNS